MAVVDTLSGMKLLIKLVATQKNTINANESVAGAFGVTFSPDALTNGTGANQADKWWGAEGRALAQGASEVLDLFDFAAFDIGAGAGKDIAGQSLALVEVCALVIINDTTSTGSIKFGGDGAATAFNSIFNGNDSAELGPFPPGAGNAVWSFADPAFAVADGSNHLVTVTETGVGAITYSAYILGRSA